MLKNGEKDQLNLNLLNVEKIGKYKKIPNMDNLFACLWVKITTENSSFIVATVYHPPDHIYNANDLIEFLINSCKQLLSENPNAKIIITGDINRLNICDLLNYPLPNGQIIYKR